MDRRNMVDRKNTIYNFINIFVILATIMTFVYGYKNALEIFSDSTILSVCILTVTVVLVHMIKAGRLYLALYGYDMNFIDYMKTYCKVTPVSIVVPFKLGEVFRMYCYGKLLDNMLKSVVIILFDRFMDTIALVTAIILAWIINGGNITSFVYVLIIFLIFILLVYYAYPGVYKFWNKYLLKSKASEHKLTALKILTALNLLHRSIENVAKGRGVVLYFMSLIAWGVEIGSLALINKLGGTGDISKIISDYLASAMSGSQSIELKQFVIVSVVFLIIIYVIIKAAEIIVRKKG